LQGFVVNTAATGGSVIMNSQTGEVMQGGDSAATAKPSSSSSSSSAAAPKTEVMELYCKAAADGKSLGDCPFTHYVSMVLHAKGLKFDLKPCTPETKPDWLVKGYEGKVSNSTHFNICIHFLAIYCCCCCCKQAIAVTVAVWLQC
jgi:hypothetical protein